MISTGTVADHGLDTQRTQAKPPAGSLQLSKSLNVSLQPRLGDYWYHVQEVQQR